MTDGQVRCDDGNPAACEQVDVDAGMLTPQPTRRYQRATHATVDHRFNCRATYPDYHGVPIEGCPDAGTRPAYIDDLRAAIGSSGAPAGFQRWRASYGCNDPTVPASLPGNWWIDCPTFRISENANINFSGGNIVFDGDVSMTGEASASTRPTRPLRCRRHASPRWLAPRAAPPSTPRVRVPPDRRPEDVQRVAERGTAPR